MFTDPHRKDAVVLDRFSSAVLPGTPSFRGTILLARLQCPLFHNVNEDRVIILWRPRLQPVMHMDEKC